MRGYRATEEIPPLVGRALDLAERMRFPHSCISEVGRLLRAMAGSCRSGVVAEIGTGCGVGAAWMVSGLAPGVPLVTVESDAERASAARALFAPYPNVRVLHGDWPAILAHAPFALLFADGGRAKEREPECLLSALAPGGLILLDDLTPESRWKPEQRAQWPVDPVRAFWLNDPRLLATELLTTSESGVILAARLNDRDGGGTPTA